MRLLFKPSLICFFLTLIIYLGQLFPPTGIFLMMFGGILWAALTINAGFILLILECLLRVWPRWVLMFPILYFGGYMILAVASHYEYYNLQKEIEAHNSQIRIPFDSSKNDLVLSSKADIQIFLTTYGLPSIYESNPNYKPKKYLINMIGDQKACQAARGMGFKSGFSAFPIRSHEKTKDNAFIGSLGKTVPGICLLKYPQDPQKPTYAVSIAENKIASRLLPLKKTTLTVSGPDAQEYVLKGGFADPYKWLPIPVLGCGLNSARASWDCVHGFARDGYQPLNKGPARFAGDTRALAEALGLKPVSEQEKFKPKNTSTDISEIASNIRQSKKEDAYTRFATLLSDPIGYNQSLNFSSILSDQQYLKANISQIIEALDQLKDIDTWKAEKKRALSLAIVSLPLEIIQENSSALLNLFNSFTAKNWVWHNKELFIRLGDLGFEAYPLFTKLLENNQAAKLGAISQDRPIAYAICRAGSATAPLVEDMLLEKLRYISQYSQYYEDKRALYMALIRIGLRDQAEQVLTAGDIGILRSGDQFISENSPANDCVDIKGKPIYPN